MKSYNEFCQVENTYAAWKQFQLGKSDRRDIIFFDRRLDRELSALEKDLLNGRYLHGSYEQFIVHDPKFRIVHKAQVRDRILHQALFDELYPVFNKIFFFDSYSCRIGKGTQRARERLRQYARQAGVNGRKEAWILHADIKKFFDSVDHDLLFEFIGWRLCDKNYLALCQKIITSFCTMPGKGMPLGNLTSQLFANIYMHELDYYIKQIMGEKRYLRYNDDFYIVSDNKNYLIEAAIKIKKYVEDKMRLALPEKKIKIRRLSAGVDILGAVVFPWGSVPRRLMNKRAEAVIERNGNEGYSLVNWRQSVSYIGLIGDMHAHNMREKLRLNIFEKIIVK